MTGRYNLPVSVGGAALASRALGAFAGTTPAVVGGSQVTRGSVHITLLESESTRLAII